MTTGTVIALPPGTAAQHAGVVTADTSGLAGIHGLGGGTGTVRWKTLADGTQLPGGGWKRVAYCEVPPGAGIGRPLHAEPSDKVYYILSGHAAMTVNDLDEIDVRAGQAVTCPAGSVHGIRVPAPARQPATFFLAELFPGPASPRAAAELLPLAGKLDWCEGYRGGGHGQETRVAVVDLTRHLRGPGRRFSLIEMQPGETRAYQLPGRVSEVLFVTCGRAEIITGGVTQQGAAGCCVGTPLAALVTIRNLSSDQPLTVTSTEVAA